MNTKLYSIPELSRILNLHPKTILRFIHEGKIKAGKIGRTWRVGDEDLKSFCHGELSVVDAPKSEPQYNTLGERISVSAVIEIKEHNSEEAARLSNLLLAMLNSDRDSDGKSRFEFFYYPEIEKAKYVFYGSSQFIARTISVFETFSSIKE